MTTGLRWDDAQLAAYTRKRSPVVGTWAANANTVRLVLPWPPSLNHSGADSFRGGRKTEAYKQFMADVARIVVDAGSPKIEGRLQVDIAIVPPDRRARDLDNLAKATLDSLQRAGCFENDSQIDDLRIRRFPVFIGGEGGCTVTIHRVTAAT